MPLTNRWTRRAVLATIPSLTTVLDRQPARAWPSNRWRSVRLVVIPNPVAFDAPFTVRVSGLAARQPVTLSAQVIDDAGLTWTAFGEFVADAHGWVDLTTQAPRSGTWATADPMGLVWSLTPSGTPANTWDYTSVLELPPLTI